MVRDNQAAFVVRMVGALCCAVLPVDGRAADQAGDKLWGENLVFNPSFEEGADTQTGWTRRRAFMLSQESTPSIISIDKAVAHSGKQSLHISGSPDTTVWHSIESKSIPVKPGENYRVEGWIKTKYVTAVGRQPLHCNLHVRFSNDQGASVRVGGSSVVVTRTISGTEDWTKVERVVTAPEGAVEARVGCVLTCTGTAWFDDVKFQEQRTIPWNKKDTDRITFFSEATEMMSYFYEEPTVTKELLANKKQKIKEEDLPKIFEILISTLEGIDDWNGETLKETLFKAAEKNDLKRGQLLWPMRAALTGLQYSPGAFEVAEVLGKEKTLSRLKASQP